VEGEADPGADGATLRRAELDRKLVGVGMRRLFFSTFPADPKAKAPEPPAAEMEQRLLAAQPVDPAALADLAQRRAKAVLAALQALQAPQDRVFQTMGTRTGDEAAQSKVWFAVQ